MSVEKYLKERLLIDENQNVNTKFDELVSTVKMLIKGVAKNKEMYMVVVDQGSYDGSWTEEKFVTLDINKAELWVAKFNGIINENKNRLQKVAYSEEEHINYFWWDYVGWDTPIASFRKIEFR